MLSSTAHIYLPCLYELLTPREKGCLLAVNREISSLMREAINRDTSLWLCFRCSQRLLCSNPFSRFWLYHVRSVCRAPPPYPRWPTIGVRGSLLH